MPQLDAAHDQGRKVLPSMRHHRACPFAEKMGGTGSGMQTRIKRHRIGEVSSKYGYNPGQFDQDLEARKARSDALWLYFQKWMKRHEITPDEARVLFRRLFEEYLE